MNFKEYLAWFRIQDSAVNMAMPGLPFRSSVRRVFILKIDRLIILRSWIQIIYL